MTDFAAVKPTVLELRAARELLDDVARFVPVAADSVPARLANTREIVLALVAAGWLPPRFRTCTSEPDVATGVMVSGLDTPEPEFLMERSVSVLRKSARYKGVQPNGKPPLLKNEREVLDALIAAGWLGIGARDHGAANDYLLRSRGMTLDLGATVHSRPTAAAMA